MSRCSVRTRPPRPSLRRRKTNGIMSGMLYFFFRDNSDANLQGHMANFVVGNTSDRPVYVPAFVCDVHGMV